MHVPHTASAHMKQKAPYAETLRKMSSRLRQVQDELAAESVTNIKFEEASRRSFDYLAAQLRTLKEAFNTLTDSLLSELDGVSATLSDELRHLGTRHTEMERGMVRAMSEAAEAVSKQKELEQWMQRASCDMELVKGAVPKLEEIETWTRRMSVDLESVRLTSPKMDELEKSTRRVSGELDALRGSMLKLEELEKYARRASSDFDTLRIAMPKLDELDEQAHRMSCDLDRALRAVPKVEELEKKLRQATGNVELMMCALPKVEGLNKWAVQLSAELDAVMGVIPKLEDKIDAAARDVGRACDEVAKKHARFSELTEHVDMKLKNFELSLREDMEQRHLRLQRSITKQLEGMSRVLAEADPAAAQQPLGAQTLGGKLLKASPLRRAHDMDFGDRFAETAR